VTFVDAEHSHFTKIGKVGNDLDNDTSNTAEGSNNIDPGLSGGAPCLSVDFVMNLMQLGD
jgi:hypothetical protein